MNDLLQTLQVIVRQLFDLISALVEFLWTSSISTPSPTFVGVILVAFLLGLLLGRFSRHAAREALEEVHESRSDGVVLDLERLTPLGLSVEEEAENEAMDISGIRSDEGREKPGQDGRRDHVGTEAAPDK
jgi:hypothetical protein